MHGIANKVVYEELWGPGLQEKEAQRGDLALVGELLPKSSYWLEKNNWEADNMSRSLTEPWDREINVEIKIGYIVYKFEGTGRHNFFVSEEYLKNPDAEKY